MNWQPIETAPRYKEGSDSGPEVLACNRGTGEMAYGLVREFKGHGALDDGTGGVAGLGVIRRMVPWIATHWCQPEPPQ